MRGKTYKLKYFLDVVSDRNSKSKHFFILLRLTSETKIAKKCQIQGDSGTFWKFWITLQKRPKWQCENKEKASPLLQISMKF